MNVWVLHAPFPCQNSSVRLSSSPAPGKKRTRSRMKQEKLLMVCVHVRQHLVSDNHLALVTDTDPSEFSKEVKHD